MQRALAWVVAFLFLFSESAVLRDARSDDSGATPEAAAEGSGGESVALLDSPPELGADAGAAAPVEKKASPKKGSKKSKKKAKKNTKKPKKHAKKGSKKTAKGKKGSKKRELGLPAADPTPGPDAGQAAEFMPPPPAPESTPSE